MKQEETKAFLPNTKTLARNTVINFCGQAIVALSALIMVPHIVRGLGYSAYGLLSLALLVFGSFSLLELGLGRATTKYVAEYLSTREYEKIGSVVWTSLSIQLIIGSVGGAVLALATPALTIRMNLQVELIPDATKVFYILAVSAPLILCTSALRGALEGAQRFDLVNYAKIALNLSTYLIPLLCARLNIAVSVIVFYMLLARIVAIATYFMLVLYTLPQTKKISPFKNIRVKTLFSYAGWVAISNLITPFLVQIDRYFIASLVAVSAVTFYAVPFELLNGLWIIPGSIASVLFPAFSSSKLSESYIYALFHRSIKYILLSLGPVVLFFVVFSTEILTIWQSVDFATRSSVVLQILVMGVLVNSLGWVPSNLVMGVGRPDVTAKIHILQTPLYLFVVYFLISKYGIIGAASAFTLRVLFEAVLSFITALHLHPFLKRSILTNNYGNILSLIMLIMILFLEKEFIFTSQVYKITILAITYLVYYLVAYIFLLDNFDKEFILEKFRRKNLEKELTHG